MESSDTLPTVNSRVGNFISTLGIPQRVLLSIFGFLAIINASSLRLSLDTTLEKIVNSNQNLNFENNRLFGSGSFAQNTSLADCEKLGCIEVNKNSSTLWAEFKNIYKERSTAPWSEVKATLREKFNKNGKQFEFMKASSVSAPATELNWSKRAQTIVVMSFYAGYILSQIPGGMLAQKYGGKRVLAFSLTAAAILTILTPLTIQKGGLGPLILLRLLLGLCEGPAFPALSTLLARWVPPTERGKLCSFALSGGQVGVVLVNIVSTLVFHLSHWPVIFYFFGACALIWALGFVLICSDEPASDPYIRSNECIYLQESFSDLEPTTGSTPIPWKEIFINVPVWAMISSAIQYNWAQAEGMTLLPQTQNSFEEKTLAEELNEKVKASMPHVINWVISVVSGTVCDILVELDIVTTTDVRKTMAAITALGPRFIKDLNSCLTCNEHDDFISRANCAIGVIGTFYAGAKLTPLDLSPNYAGILMAISNGIGSLSAVLIPQLEEIFPNSSLFRNLRSTLCLISALLTSGDVQNFDSITLMQQRENS